MDKITVTFNLASSNYTAALGFELLLDDKVLLSIDHVKESVPVSVEIDNDEGEHEFKFVMKNKTQEHTTIDDDGNIVEDAVLSIANVTVDDIKLEHLFVEKSVYYHDFNGSQDSIKDKFFGVMGCNGYVSLRFTTPIYLWLLENM
jgi:uncharacterized membrane protein YkoI